MFLISQDGDGFPDNDVKMNKIKSAIDAVLKNKT